VGVAVVPQPLLEFELAAVQDDANEDANGRANEAYVSFTIHHPRNTDGLSRSIIPQDLERILKWIYPPRQI
jgi:hypothetical protein